MNIFKLSVVVLCGSFLLASCGGEGLTAGGASLGGTGSTPGGTDAQPTDPNPEDRLDYLHTIHYHQPVTDLCGSLKRTIYFKNTNGDKVSDAQSHETFNGRIEVIVQLENQGSLLLEKHAQCKSPIGVFNSSGAKIGDQVTDCEHDDGVTWRMLTSQKETQYRFVAYIPQMEENYYVSYQAEYVQPDAQQMTLENLDAQTPATAKCEPLSLPFELVKIDPDSQPVQNEGNASVGDPVS